MTEQHLKDLRAIFEKDGSWCQLAFEKEENMSGACCLVGGIYRLMGNGDSAPFGPMIDALKDQISDLTIHHYNSLAAWNDYHGRTREQVLDLIDKAIAAVS